MMGVYGYARIHNRLQVYYQGKGLHVNPSETQETKTTNTNNHGRGTDMGIDPKLNYCSCGYTFTVSTLQKLRMLLQDSIIITCPRCGNRMTYRLIHHTVKVNSEPIKNKGEVYKNG